MQVHNQISNPGHTGKERRIVSPVLNNTLKFVTMVHFSPFVLQPNSGLGRLHETFRFTSVTRFGTVGRTPWTGDRLVARPLPVHKHSKTHTQKKH
jgi:hypothetical protein